MIFGQILEISNDPSSGSVIGKVQKNLQWDGCLSCTIQYGNFTGVCLHDPRLFLNEKDFVFINEKEDTLVLLDGYIYNKKKLALDLSYDEAAPTPELIGRAFQQMGVFFANALNGDFSICVYQKKGNQAFFYRDHLGIRPLATAKLENGLAFSTDIMGLSKALFRNQKIEPGFLRNKFLITGFNYFLTPAKHLQKINPGCFLKYSGGKTEEKAFWSPEKIKTDNRLNIDQVKKDLRELLLNAVTLRVDSRLKASAHVSGGLDSGVVAVLSRRILRDQENFYGFSWTPDTAPFDQKIAFDERILVKKICEPYGIIPVFNNFTLEDRLQELKDWRHPSELMFEKKIIGFARGKGVQVIFSGWGGDEFISLGSWGIDADLIRAGHWFGFLRRHPLRHPRRLISSLIFNALFPLIRKPFARQKTHPFVFQYLVGMSDSNKIPRRERLKFTSRRKVHLHLLKHHHLNQRTDDWYVLGQRNGVEYRYPLLDKRIVEYMLKVPSHSLIAPDHYRMILREIGKEYLPLEVIQNTSKDDPIRSASFYTVGVNATRPFFNEIEEFKNNPDLDFFDFELLENHIKEFQENPKSHKEEELLTTLYFLKKAHEFTRGYYSDCED